MRKGKMAAWGPAFEEVQIDHRVRRRLGICIEELMPNAAMQARMEVPDSVLATERRRLKRKRLRDEEQLYQLPHLRSPSPPQSTSKLAPILALPHTYVDIMISPSMRHSLGDDSMETSLQATAGELLDGEKGLMQALGRLREVLRVRSRDVPEAEVEEAKAVNGNHTGSNGHGSEPGAMAVDAPRGSPPPSQGDALIPPLPHISDTDNLWRVTQELLQGQPQPTITFTVTPPGAAAPTTVLPTATTTPVHRLFTCSTGITVNAIPNASHPGMAFPTTHPAYPVTQKYNLDLTNQRRAVDDALERISELLADCNEYKERLEEARGRVADVARARKKVWAVIKERAGLELDREEGRCSDRDAELLYFPSRLYYTMMDRYGDFVIYPCCDLLKRTSNSRREAIVRIIYRITKSSETRSDSLQCPPMRSPS
jgi:hypothetical protein